MLIEAAGLCRNGAGLAGPSALRGAALSARPAASKSGFLEIVNIYDTNFALAGFARATTGTYIDSAGVRQTAAINAPRYDYDPVTLVLRGLLMEASATNFILNSDSMSTQTFTPPNAARALSFEGTGTVTLSGSFTGSLVGIGDGPANRVVLFFTPTNAPLTLTVTGTVNYAQVEGAATIATATSYIPTGGTTVTRSADTSGASVLAHYNFPWNNAEGTFYIEGMVPAVSGTQTLLRFGIPSALERVDMNISNVSPNSQLVASGGAPGLICPNSPVVANSIFKFAFAFRKNNIAAAFNGANKVVGSNAPVMPNAIRGNTSIFIPVAAWFRRVRYYPSFHDPVALTQNAQ